MKVEYWLFVGGGLFFLPLGVIYGWLSAWEAVGTTGILLVGGLFALVGSYLYVTSRRIDERPEDDVYGEVEQGAGEQGVFAPHSWWPLWLGAAIGVTFLGMAMAFWLVLIGIGLSALALVGWVFEFYRGAHAH
ncbi:cytochrome c oxidase subunit 4 [Quadrisphaera sp. DSM 44207]|uniref:cytochrome c oxidase subunit 4 n=1 Tax=Quadrisphaera sp. DSM 44207 TaxID=1881057 RepID=UPI00088A063F|nr:cytochrome c oxidase subunit 4 [Quadrisphaera sp. DSM 44207]SDQ33075.1 Cytochrome c oxidase subunit IV [Quadrisphaera sp. DSM 44207]